MDININELRIGSSVKCKVSNDAGVYQVIAIDGWNQKVMLNGVRHGTWYNIERIKPIKLTSEIMKLYNWNPQERFEWLDQLDRYEIQIDETSYLRGSRNKTEKIKYLHELENLCISLTKKELEKI